VKSTSGVEGLYDIDLLARMLQVGIVAYMVGGAFLSLSYFDLPWHLISIALIIGRLIDLNNKKN
jgi:hypothetical protein